MIMKIIFRRSDHGQKEPKIPFNQKVYSRMC